MFLERQAAVEVFKYHSLFMSEINQKSRFSQNLKRKILLSVCIAGYVSGIIRPQWNISVNIWWITITFSTDILGPRRIIPNDFSDPLTSSCSKLYIFKTRCIKMHILHLTCWYFRSPNTTHDGLFVCLGPLFWHPPLAKCLYSALPLPWQLLLKSKLWTPALIDLSLIFFTMSITASGVSVD